MAEDRLGACRVFTSPAIPRAPPSRSRGTSWSRCRGVLPRQSHASITYCMIVMEYAGVCRVWISWLYMGIDAPSLPAARPDAQGKGRPEVVPVFRTGR